MSGIDYKLKIFKADWNKYGRSAGPIRNKEMLDYADHVIAFYDGISKGTGNLLDNTTKHNVFIINY